MTVRVFLIWLTSTNTPWIRWHISKIKEPMTIRVAVNNDRMRQRSFIE